MIFVGSRPAVSQRYNAGGGRAAGRHTGVEGDNGWLACKVWENQSIHWSTSEFQGGSGYCLFCLEFMGWIVSWALTNFHGLFFGMLHGQKIPFCWGISDSDPRRISVRCFSNKLISSSILASVPGRRFGRSGFFCWKKTPPDRFKWRSWNLKNHGPVWKKDNQTTSISFIFLVQNCSFQGWIIFEQRKRRTRMEVDLDAEGMNTLLGRLTTSHSPLKT